MRFTNSKNVVLLIIGLLFVSFLSGCTDWKAEYDKLYVKNQNLEGQLEGKKAEQQDLVDRISRDKQTIAELQRQIEVNKKTPAQASGFEGFEVAFNANEGTITVTLENSILFDSGQADLKKTTNNELNSIYSVLKSKYSGKKIDIVGHTDTDPIQKSNWKDNWELSAQRSLSVTRYLVSRGWPEKQIQAVACGEARPVVSNNSSANKAKNRRVEIVVHMK
ncbi:MAG: OmpA family protein [Sedimentisphaerales bacterium]|nr:OmpA family protein [Sedimentisphaerales bacterium]